MNGDTHERIAPPAPSGKVPPTLKGTPSADRDRHFSARLFWCGWFAAVLFYFLTLNVHGFWHDEIRTIRSGQLPFSEMIRERARAGHQPVYFVLSFAWQRLFGESEQMIRLPAMAFGLLSLVVLFRLVEKIADARTACYATLLLAISPMQLFLSQMARMYTLVQVLSLVLTWILLQERVERRHQIGFALLWTVNLFTHFSAYLVLVAHGLWLLGQGRRQRELAGGLILAVGLHLQWLFFFPETHNAERNLSWLPKLEFMAAAKVVNAIAFGSYFTEVGSLPALLIAILFTGLAIGGVYRVRKEPAIPLLWLVPLTVALTLSVFGLNLIRVHRYFSTSLAAHAALISLGTWRIPARGLRWLCGVTVVTIQILGLYCYLTVHPIAPWREMAVLVRERRGDHEVVIAVADRVLTSSFEHYYGLPYVATTSADDALPHGIDGVWFCVHPDRKRLARRMVERGRERFTRIDQFPVERGLVVHLYQPNP